MKNKVIATPYFVSRFKKFRKKFISLDKEIKLLEDNLLNDPQTGEALGGGLYKIRLASESKGKGKSGGFRVITYLVKEVANGTEIYLITMYDKSEESSINKQNLLLLIKKIFE